MKTPEECGHNPDLVQHCPICEGGLGLCRMCGAAEVQLDEHTTCESFREAAPLRERVNELEALFNLQWRADQRAIKMWQAKTGKDRVWPDDAKLSVWLLERLDEAEARIRGVSKEEVETG